MKTSTKQRINDLAKGYNTVPPVSGDLVTLTLYQVSHCTPHCGT